MGVLDEELNGCYAMLCEALRAWHRMQKDHPRETAAKVLKDVYGYEFHLNGGGCPWRLPSVDHEWAANGMRALGLPADRFSSPAHENRYRWTILECDGRYVVCVRERLALPDGLLAYTVADRTGGPIAFRHPDGA